MKNLNSLVIHHIELAHSSQNISGGEKALIESVRYIQNVNPEIQQIIYTSESGTQVYNRLLGSDQNNVSYVSIGPIKYEKIHNYFAFYLRCFQQFKFLKKLDSSKNHIIFSHEEFLPTMIFSFLLHKKNPFSKWVFFYHMKAPSLFKGYEGEFTNRYSIPSLKVIRYLLEQQFAYYVTKSSDLVLTVNSYYKELLEKKYKNIPVYVIKRYSGITVPKDIKSKKLYDLVWMGRFHPQKGIFEIINIIKIIKRKMPNIKLVVLGGGDNALESQFRESIEINNLQDNIDFKGFIIGDDRFNHLKKGRVFMMTSFYESFGQVNLEAMKCGIPVVAYNLPVYGVFEKGMIKVSPLDNSSFAAEIERLLSDKSYYEVKAKESLDFASEFSWTTTSKEILDQLKLTL